MAEQDEVQQGVTVRVGDTWEDMAPSDEEKSGPRRRVGILAFDGDHAVVENKVSRVESSVRVDRFKPPFWRFIG